MRATKLRHTQAKCRCLIASLTIIVNSQKKSNCFEGTLRKNFSGRARRGKRGPKVRGKPLCLASGRLPFRLRTRFPQVRSFEGKRALSPKSAFGQVFSFPDDPPFCRVFASRGGFQAAFLRAFPFWAVILFPGGPPYLQIFSSPAAF